MKKKLQFGNGENPGFGFADMIQSRAQNQRAINDIKNMKGGLTNPWVRDNPLSLSRPANSNNLVNVSEIDPAVLVNKPTAIVKPNKKPAKNPTLGFSAGATPGQGQNLKLNFNTNQGGRGINLSTNTNFNNPNSQSSNILDNSSVTLSGNQIPLSFTLGGDGSVSAGGNIDLNQWKKNREAKKKNKKVKKKGKKN